MREKQFRLKQCVFIILLLLVLFPFPNAWRHTLLAAESGGVTGAEFLNMSPTPRYNSMGGVIDGLGNGLEGIHYNPALLTPLESLSLQLNVNPYPNGVSHDQVSFGLPLFGGVGAVSLQLLNTGGFTYVNENLQPEETYSVYDTAASIGYSRYVWRTLSAGVSVKAIYRVLGEYTAFAAGSDIGAAYWFETPHFGQRPKPPSDKKLEKEFLSEKKSLDNEREGRIKEASKIVEALKKQIADLESERNKISQKIIQVDEEKKGPLEEKQKALSEEINTLNQALLIEEERAGQSLAEIEEWYATGVKQAQDAYNQKLSNLVIVESERRTLFSIINDPNKELSDEIIDTYIDDIITKMNNFLDGRKDSLQKSNDIYRNRRLKRIDEIRKEIEAYKTQIENEIEPQENKLQEEVDTLKQELQSLRAKEGEGEKEKISTIQKKINEKEKELQTLVNNPWIQRLEKRTQEKERQIASIESDIAEKDEETKKVIEEITQSTQKDLNEFEALRGWIKRELKKAKLKRELDLLKADKEHKQQKVLKNYKAKEKELYLRLLAVMYEYEDNILQVRISAVKEDFENRKFDYETDLQKERERLEDEFSFQQRYLSTKITQLEKNIGKSSSSDDESKKKLDSLKDELKQKETSYSKKVNNLKDEEKEFLTREQEQLENKISELDWQIELVRLVYLQTDTPYLNTSVNLSLKNLGTQVKFVEEGYPLPTNFHLGIGYAIVNNENHAVKIGVQANFPFYNTISVGIGAEYGFLDMVFIRTGYCFGSLNRSFSAGLGAKIGIGFTQYAVDYSFQPLPEYGILHSFGISAYF